MHVGMIFTFYRVLQASEKRGIIITVLRVSVGVPRVAFDAKFVVFILNLEREVCVGVRWRKRF